MGGAVVALLVVGCRSNSLASTNVANGQHVLTPSTTGSFTITDATVAGIRQKVTEMFGESNDQARYGRLRSGRNRDAGAPGEPAVAAVVRSSHDPSASLVPT